jgi:hypothetical protein
MRKVLIVLLVAIGTLWVGADQFAKWALQGKADGQLLGAVNRDAESKIIRAVRPAITERSDRFAISAAAPCFAPLKPVASPNGPCEAMSTALREVPTDQCRPILTGGTIERDGSGRSRVSKTTILVVSELLSAESLSQIEDELRPHLLSSTACRGFHLFEVSGK